MAMHAVVTGRIAEPVLRWTPKQQAVLDLRVNATAAARDKTSGQWSDIGAPLWVSATFWEAEAQTLQSALKKGDRVTVEGTLVVETFQRREGGSGQSYVLRYPKFLGVIPSRRAVSDGGMQQASAVPAHEAPSSADPWGESDHFSHEQAPF